MTRAIILGADNFIGNNVLRAALAAGYECVAWCATHRPTRAFADLDVSIAVGEIGDRQTLVGTMRRCDVVFHCAGYAPPNSRRYDRRIRDAAQHITNVLEAVLIAGVPQVIYTSSWCTVGRAGGFYNRLADEADYYRMGQVRHPYWDAKLIQEQRIMDYVRKGLSVVILNPTELAGPYDFDLHHLRGLVNISKGRGRFYLPGRVCLTDGRDAAQAHIAAVERGISGERYILGGHNLTRREQVELMARVCQVRTAPCALPFDIVAPLAYSAERISCLGNADRHFHATFAVEWARRQAWYDHSKAKNELNWQPRPLSATYRDALAWLGQTSKG